MARGLKAKPLTTGRELALAAAPCPEGIILITDIIVQLKGAVCKALFIF
jgi:hypothetical protein